MRKACTTSVWMLLRCKRLTLFAQRMLKCWKKTLLFQYSAIAVALGYLIGHNLNTGVDFVFAGDGCRLVVIGVAVKSFAFRVVAVYAPNYIDERRSVFRRLELFFGDSKWIVLVGDWNTILDAKIDKVGKGVSGLDRCESSLVDFMARFNFVDSFRLDHQGR